MAANTTPIFVRSLRNSGVSTGTTANTSLTGTGTLASDIQTVFTADATNGSKVETVTLTHLGSNVATVVRLFVNNGSSNGTPSNNNLVKEIAMAANTLDQAAASTAATWNANLYLPAGYKLLATIGTAIAAGIMVNAQGGDF